MSDQDWKSRLGVVYSTNPNFNYDAPAEEEVETLAPKDQRLVITIDRKNRGGKQVTLVKNFRGTEADMLALAKVLKTKCGVGGAVKDGEIIIQGDFREKILDYLLSNNYGAKRGN